MPKIQPDFTKAIEWGTSHEPNVLTWQIKTIGHQWQKFGYFCIFVISVFIAIFLAVFIHGFEDWGTPVLPLIGVFVFGLGLFGEVRRKTWFVYRFIDRGAEIAHWRAYPKILFVLIRWGFAILGVVVMIIGIALGEAAVAMVGPIGIIMSLGTWAITKDYQETMTAYDQSAYNWSYIQEAYYDQKRNVIMLRHVHPPYTAEERKKYIEEQGFTDERLDRVIMECDFYLFPTPKLTEKILSITQQHIPKAVTLHNQKVILPEIV